MADHAFGGVGSVAHVAVLNKHAFAVTYVGDADGLSRGAPVVNSATSAAKIAIATRARIVVRASAARRTRAAFCKLRRVTGPPELLLIGRRELLAKRLVDVSKNSSCADAVSEL